MKIMSAIFGTMMVTASGLPFVTSSAAGEEITTATAMTKEDRAIDCTKEVWPELLSVVS